jgi:hypothetical protein
MSFSMEVLLTGRERTWPPRVFIPEAVATTQVPESLGDEAAKGRTDHAPWHGAFRYACGPEVHVIRVTADK